MNLIGETLTILTSRDPTQTGKTGRVLIETANTLLLESGGRTVRVAKTEAAFKILGSGRMVKGSDIAGRLQDRWGRKRP
jgi:RNase P/RNase MRP subunit p29